jgi:hypothetical protein
VLGHDDDDSVAGRWSVWLQNGQGQRRNVNENMCAGSVNVTVRVSLCSAILLLVELYKEPL